MRDNPAYDQIIQGLSGMMSITGTPETAPLRVGYPVADTLGGLAAAFAIAAALVGQQTRGEGAFLDVSMLECTLSALGWPVSNLSHRRRRAAADGQREHDRRAFRHVPHRRRAAQHRRQQAGAVRDALPR